MPTLHSTAWVYKTACLCSRFPSWALVRFLYIFQSRYRIVSFLLPILMCITDGVTCSQDFSFLFICIFYDQLNLTRNPLRLSYITAMHFSFVAIALTIAATAAPALAVPVRLL